MTLQTELDLPPQSRIMTTKSFLNLAAACSVVQYVRQQFIHFKAVIGSVFLFLQQTASVILLAAGSDAKQL